MSTLAELLARRRMVRDFDPTAPVEDDALTPVLDAGLATPSAGHAQVVSLVVLAGARVADFWRVSSEAAADNAWLRGMRRAPVLVTVWTSEDAYRARYAEPDKTHAELAAPWWWVDAGMSVLAMLLTVEDVGLDACFFGVPIERQDALAALIDVPPGWSSAGVLAVGHRAVGERARGSGRRRPRRPRSERVRFDRW